MKFTKTSIVIILLSVTLFIAYALPSEQFKGTGFISQLELPGSFDDWTGRDVSDQLDIDFEKITYKFMSDAISYQYKKNKGGSLLLMILDAGNFHEPKVCYTHAGFEVKGLGDAEFHTENRTIKAHALFTKKNNDSFLSFYWVIIDKDITHNWTNQKLKQLYFTLSRKERIGLMVRIDIPTEEDTIDDATVLAKQFINEFNSVLPSEQAAYILGEKKIRQL